jgi:flagellin-like protein
MFNKRGISSIIATLLLVLLTIVLIGIIWVVVNNLVSSSRQGISISGLTLDLKIKQAIKGGNNLSIIVQRQPGAGDLTGVNFVISDGTIYEVIKQNASLNIYEGRSFSLIPPQMSINSVKTVSVAPIYNSENGGQQIGSVTDTYTFGNGSIVGGSSCIPAINQSGLCTGYACGEVNNGTCSTVSCGQCSSGQICNFVSHQCTSGGGSGCSPAPNPTFAALCTTPGYACGEVNNGTCTPVSCGTCGSGQFCDLSNHQCADVQNPQCIPTTCQQSNYQCGAPPDGCGQALNCGNCTGNSFCNNVWQCETYTMENSGTVFSAWPSAPLYFDGVSLPTDSNSIASYNDALHYIRFPASNYSGCVQLAFISPEPSPSTMSYVRLGNSATIAAGNNYQIWNSQQGCLAHPGYS